MDLFWKIYFWFYLLLILAGYTAGLSYLDFSKVAWDVVDFIHTGLLFISLIGLCGFVFSKPFGWPAFWKVMSVVIIGYDLAHDTYMSISDWKIVPDEYKTLKLMGLTMGAAILGYLIVLPLWIALYRYGYRRQDIWEVTRSANR